MDPIKALAAALPEDIDGALILSTVNRQYYTGFPSSAGQLLVTRRGATLLLDSRYDEAGSRRVKNAAVARCDNLKDQLNELCERDGVKTLGIETSYLTVERLDGLRRILDAKILDDSRVDRLILEQRRLKTPEEIATIRAAQAVTDRAFAYMLGFLRPGITEKDAALELDYYMLKNGADALAFDTILASGPNGSMPHAVPGGRVLQSGDFITMDFGAAVGGYCSDMTRTVALGRVSDEQRAVYELVLKAQCDAIAAVKAGLPCDKIDAVARGLIHGAGYKENFGHGLGHGIGLEVHEEPRFSPACDVLTQPGMILSVEPGIYLPGKFGVRIEDLVVITEEGCENLTASPKELISL